MTPAPILGPHCVNRSTKLIHPVIIGIVGAGLAGSTAAVLPREKGHSVEIFEQREHLGGNCHDEWDSGILVHKYGPHGFHTNNRSAWDFVNRFSRFHETALKVTANTGPGMIPAPFNNESARIVGDLEPDEIRNLIFRDDSEKHWGVPREKVPRSITTRVPERRHSSDGRYHLDRWQGVREHGYNRMFQTMFDGISCHIGCPEDSWRRYRFDHVIHTGSVDDDFARAHDRLEYRSLRFNCGTEPKRVHFQINECNHQKPWTPSVDHSHWLHQSVGRTIVGYEHPCEGTRALSACTRRPSPPTADATGNTGNSPRRSGT